MQPSASTATTARARYKLTDEAAIYAGVREQALLEIDRRGMVADVPALEAACRRIARWLCDPTKKQSLILLGLPGCGKTTLMRSVARYMWAVGCPSCKWYDATDLPTVRIDREVEWEDTILKGGWAAYLMLDDIGEEPVVAKDYGRDWPLFQKIVAERYTRMLPMVITTNLNFDQMAERYGERTADRLREIADLMPFANGSFRK